MKYYIHFFETNKKKKKKKYLKVNALYLINHPWHYMTGLLRYFIAITFNAYMSECVCVCFFRFVFIIVAFYILNFLTL